MLDYSRFSVTVPENEAHRIEDILGAYTDEQLVALQSALFTVRDAFIYDEGREWRREGPLYFALVSMALRLGLGFPTAAPAC